MTPEEIDAITNLTQAVNSLNAGAGIQTEILKRMATQQGVNVKNIDDSLKTFGKSVDDAAGATNSIRVADEKYAESMAHLQQATASTIVSFKNLGTALFQTERSFGKYNSSLSSAGDAALSFGRALGPLGTVLGLIVKGFTKVAELATKQADDTLKASDALSKFGGAGAISSKQLLDIGHASGLTAERLGVFVDAAKKAGTSLTSLGLTAGDGMKAFGEMTAISTEQREAYQKLGVSQEELMANQGDYLKLQEASGRSMQGMTKDMDKLRKQSLEYTDNLLTLAAMTGKNIDQIKEEQKAALSREETLIQTSMMEQEIARLKESGNELDKKRAESMQKELDARDDLLKKMESQGYDQKTKDAIAKYLATGAVDSEVAQLKRMGVPIEEFSDRIKKGEKVSGDFMNSLNKATDANVRNLGTAGMLNKATREQFGMTKGNLETAAKNRGKDMNEVIAEAERQKGKPAEGQAGGTAATDAAQNARAKLTTAEINATVKVDELVQSVNPLINGFGDMTLVMKGLAVAAGLAAASLLGIGGKSLIGKVRGFMGGGKPDMSMPGPAQAAAPGAGTGAGGAAMEVLGKGNILESAAAGLKAFADPRVALGAAGFGAAIAAVGAGLAGATWIMGKALPSLAEGLKPFEEIDGDALIDTGKGVGALGAGLAVFGVGGAAAGFGAIASSISDGLISFFGGKTPFEKIEEFSKLDIDTEKVEANSEAVVAFSKAMLALGAGSAASGIGTAVGAISDSISSFFKAEPPTEKIKKFSELDIDVEKTKTNSEAFVAFSNAMATYKGGATEGMVDALAENVSTFLKVDPPFKKFVDFSKLDISDPEKVKKNATAFVAFSDAMGKSELSGGAIAGLGKLVGGIADSAGKLVGNKTAVEKFVEFSKLNIDPEKTGKLAEAFRKYAEAMGVLSGGIKPATPSSSVSAGGSSGGSSGGGSSGGSSGGGSSGGSSGGGSSGAGMSGSEPTKVGGAGEGKPAPATTGKPISDDFKVNSILDSGPGWIKLDTDKGAIIRQGTANWRMNNPGNIRFGPFAKSQGAIGEGDAGPSGKFAVFPTLELGLKAKEDLLFGNKSKYAPMSIWDAMHRYAPESDNNKPAQYAEMIAKNAGVGVQTKLSDLNSGQRQSMLDSINKHEGFKEGKTFKAKGGGVFSGPDSGYLVELHGNEMVAPTEKFRQLLDNMSQVTKQELSSVTKSAMAAPTSNVPGAGPVFDPAVFTDMMNMMESKFTEMIDAIQTGNNTQSKILKYSKA